MGVKASKLGKLIIGGRGACKRPGGPPLSVPKGYFPIYVGVNEKDCRKFLVHTKALGHADFLELLSKSAEEYGFVNEGILRIPCEAKDFEELIIKRANLKIIYSAPPKFLDSSFCRTKLRSRERK